MKENLHNVTKGRKKRDHVKAQGRKDRKGEEEEEAHTNGPWLSNSRSKVKKYSPCQNKPVVVCLGSQEMGMKKGGFAVGLISFALVSGLFLAGCASSPNASSSSATSTSSADSYIRSGNAYYEKGDNDKAITDYDQAIRIDPNNADARRNLAQAQQRQGGQTSGQVAAMPQPARPQVQSQQTAPAKYALVIGNGNYTSISRLRNSVNDANDMAEALQSLGFIVDKVLDGDLNQMEAAVSRFRNRLSVSNNAYGFFFYAGHGVQASGINYLLPVNVNIPSENYLGERAVSVQALMGELDDAGNDLNVIVLDACRDNPFGWARSGSRGLAVLSAPVGSILVYATSANSVASDGTGRNGLFTGQLLRNLKTPGLNVQELFTKTGQDVLTASGGTQHPEISLRFFGTAYLGTRP